MIQRLYVVSAHPLASAVLVRLLSLDSVLRGCLYPKPYASSSQVPRDAEAVLVLDTTTFPGDVPSACRILRASNPSVHCLLLLHPERSSEEEMLNLVYAGIDGCLTLDEQVEVELPKGVHALLEGKLFIPAPVLRAYVRQSNALLDREASEDLPLTAREAQVFQLIARRRTNKEIAQKLHIKERTAKYHVSNILAKLKIDGREAVFRDAPFAGEASHATQARD